MQDKIKYNNINILIKNPFFVFLDKKSNDTARNKKQSIT